MTEKLRPIRSFVRRGGRLTRGQAKALSEASALLLRASDLPNLLVATSKPLILEIGFGMGHSLLEQALKNPEQDFLGVEVHEPGVGALLAGIQKEGLENLKVFSGDVTIALEQFPDEVFSGIQIFFPDPWPKKRHHKRRLIQESFLVRLARKIKPGGYLHCATDWENYAEQMLAVVKSNAAFSSVGFVERPESRPITKFERRGLRLGHGIWDLWAVKALNL